MEGHIVTIEVASKLNDSISYRERFFCKETDVQQVKRLYHKFTHDNHPEVTNAKGSHTMHIGGDFPEVRRLLSIEETETRGTRLPISFI